MAENWAAIDADVRAGLGEVGNSLVLSRSIPGTVDPQQRWVPVAPTVQIETVPQFGEGSGQYRTGETVVTTDFEFMVAVPKTMTPEMGDTIIAGGVASVIVKVEPFPAGGQPVYFTIWSDR